MVLDSSQVGATAAVREPHLLQEGLVGVLALPFTIAAPTAAQLPNDADSIEDEVTAGLAVLSGRVTSVGAHRRAEEVALAMTGIAEVLNQLDVIEPTART